VRRPGAVDSRAGDFARSGCAAAGHQEERALGGARFFACVVIAARAGRPAS
jgi:hypothetical protein